MIGTYELKANERNILSLVMSNYAIAPQHAHGLTMTKALTFDVQTGKDYTLGDLFLRNSHYVDVLSKKVKEQIASRKMDVIFNGEFKGIAPDQDFYVADQVLVLFFQPYEITPGYVGVPLFPIPIYEIEGLIKEDSPLMRLANLS